MANIGRTRRAARALGSRVAKTSRTKVSSKRKPGKTQAPSLDATPSAAIASSSGSFRLSFGRRGLLGSTAIIGIGLATAFGFGRDVLAAPKGGMVTAGKGTISATGTLTTVTTVTNQTIINWQSFSVAGNETVKFMQPNAASSVLNRIAGGDPSVILGDIQSNGRIYLINPSGVVFGAGARIDTAGLVASTLQLTDKDFLAKGDQHFIGTSQASVTNLGAINVNGGDAALIGRNVSNAGTITAPQGTVALAAGGEVLLKAQGSTDRIYVLAGPAAPSGGNAAATDTGVANSGTIQAAAAELKAAGGNMYALAINNTGTIRATGIVAGPDGHVRLVADGGTVQTGGAIASQKADGSGSGVSIDSGATGATKVSGMVDASGNRGTNTAGGSVTVTGDKVALLAGAAIDASGDAGGGTVKVGGGMHGADASVRNASSTYVDKAAGIKADARKNGQGGKVTVWSNLATGYYGNISARGGVDGGDGGKVEVSGKQFLDFQGNVDTSAPKGTTGSLLLDPSDVTICDNTQAACAATTGGAFNVLTGVFAFAGNPASNIVTWQDIRTQLQTNSVTIQTSTSGSGAGTGNITVRDAFTVNNSAAIGGASLTLDTTGTGGSIFINGAITDAVVSGQAIGLSLKSDRNIAITAPITVHGTFGATITNIAGGGSFSDTQAINAPGGISIVAGFSGDGVAAHGNLNSNITVTSLNAGGGAGNNMDVQAGGSISIAGNLTTAGGASGMLIQADNGSVTGPGTLHFAPGVTLSTGAGSLVATGGRPAGNTLGADPIDITIALVPGATQVGGINIQGDSTVTLTVPNGGLSSATGVLIEGNGSVRVQDGTVAHNPASITTSNGSIRIQAGTDPAQGGFPDPGVGNPASNLVVGALSATGGPVQLQAGGSVTTGDDTATANVKIVAGFNNGGGASTAGSNIQTGNILSTGGSAIEQAGGAITTLTINGATGVSLTTAAGDIGTGTVTSGGGIGATATLGSIVTGNESAASTITLASGTNGVTSNAGAHITTGSLSAGTTITAVTHKDGTGGGNIVVNGDITTGATGNIVLEANLDGTHPTGDTTGSGGVLIKSGAKLTLGTGNNSIVGGFGAASAINSINALLAYADTVNNRFGSFNIQGLASVAFAMAAGQPSTIAS
ncbi:MAG TPA: filamentous hemagglutinin N-terminal domain-containing protein, partial [Candidatus Cybelea sp.]|nr:filamentous hemagglutinin N-terminal domain-containing protein [Candidatus Cybelea sp.]